MRTSWFIGAFVCFIVGFLLTITIIGAIIGIPLIILGLVLLVFGLIIPESSREVHVHHHK